TLTSWNASRVLIWMALARIFSFSPMAIYLQSFIAHLPGPDISTSANWRRSERLTPDCKAIQRPTKDFQVFAWLRGHWDKVFLSRLVPRGPRNSTTTNT